MLFTVTNIIMNINDTHMKHINYNTKNIIIIIIMILTIVVIIVIIIIILHRRGPLRRPVPGGRHPLVKRGRLLL